MKEAFELTAGDGDPDDSNRNFTSLFDLMTIPPSMNNDTNPISIDFAITDNSPNQDWKKTRKKFNPDLHVTEQYGPVTILRGVLAVALIRSPVTPIRRSTEYASTRAPRLAYAGFVRLVLTAKRCPFLCRSGQVSYVSSLEIR